MSVEETNKIDFIRTEHGTGKVLLVITDHLEWDSDDESTQYHVDILERKVESYLDFVINGELNYKFPQLSRRDVVILLFCKHSPEGKGAKLISALGALLQKNNISLRVEILDSH
ncbi:DUF6572 domain-containing protein [Microvirga sp. G4-2]|uniref:DUF6572 domain-containing protein n=1 Tax=Microvirga sp. G4-2 TaxID=3434467 RepID=UPI00404410DD